MIGNKEIPEYKNKYEDKNQSIATPRKRGRPKKSEVGIAKPTDKKRGRPPKSEIEKAKAKEKLPTSMKRRKGSSLIGKMLGKETIKGETEYLLEKDPIDEAKIPKQEITQRAEIENITEPIVDNVPKQEHIIKRKSEEIKEISLDESIIRGMEKYEKEHEIEYAEETNEKLPVDKTFIVLMVFIIATIVTIVKFVDLSSIL